LSDHVYEIEDLESGHLLDVHSSRLRFYHDASLDVSADLLAQIAHNELGYDVRSIKDIRYDSETREHQVLVSWLVFEDSDENWEPLRVMHEDILDKVRVFLDRSPQRTLVEAALQALA
jgi:hypothetical protein